jgi:S-adenosylmethionine uptake transporter
MTPTPRSDAPALGMALAVLAICLLSVMDALIKVLSKDYATIQILMIRYGFGLIFAGAVFAVLRPGWPSREQFGMHVTRTGTMLISAFLFFYALARLPMAEVFVLTFTAPMFVALIARIVLRERLPPSVGWALALGFSGVLVIVVTDPSLRTGAMNHGLATLAAVLCPVTYGLTIVLLRKQTGGEPVSRIVFMQTLIGSLVLAPLALPGLSPFPLAPTGLPSGSTLWLALAVGLLGTSGLLLLSKALSKTTAARASIAEYTGLIWAALLGYALFGEVPRVAVWIGAALIIGACLVVIRVRSAPLRPSGEPPAAGTVGQGQT